MWACPACGKRFLQRRQTHSCGTIRLQRHFAARPGARVLFDVFCAAVAEAGPFRLSPARTRIGFIAAMTFAAVMPRKTYLRAHVVLLRRRESPRFVRIDHLPPYWVHVFEIRTAADVDGEMRGWIRDAYRLGRHGLAALRKTSKASPA